MKQFATPVSRACFKPAKLPVAAEYLNGGFYGGKAADLEVALRLEILCFYKFLCLNFRRIQVETWQLGRKFLHLQDHLPEVNSRGEAFRNNGKTHQYLWNQYLIEHPEQVADTDCLGRFGSRMV